MKIVHTINDLHTLLCPHMGKGIIGFIPTMGALHEGHLSLVRKSVSENNFSVVSIFVNPTQFNDKKDLETYPRDLDKDCQLLEKTNCDIVFAPNVDEMYPEPDTRKFNFGALEKVMEGEHRPGHFNGVGQIVSKLFDIVKPDKAYFGLKDFQQLAIIRKLVKDFHYPVEIVPCKILRESDGLAMSSRNALLTADKRKAAPEIYRILSEVKRRFPHSDLLELKSYVVNEFDKQSELKLEYFEIVDDKELQPIRSSSVNVPCTACIAVFAGKIRLIDNVQLY